MCTNVSLDVTDQLDDPLLLQVKELHVRGTRRTNAARVASTFLTSSVLSAEKPADACETLLVELIISELPVFTMTHMLPANAEGRVYSSQVCTSSKLRVRDSLQNTL